jgi:hypothetical protein
MYANQILYRSVNAIYFHVLLHTYVALYNVVEKRSRRHEIQHLGCVILSDGTISIIQVFRIGKYGATIHSLISRIN